MGTEARCLIKGDRELNRKWQIQFFSIRMGYAEFSYLRFKHVTTVAGLNCLVHVLYVVTMVEMRGLGS